MTSCSLQPGTTTPGTRKIALANPHGELNPGDDLIVTYTNCWLDDPADTYDVLLDGTITMNGYIENSTPFSTGFDEFRFDSLVERETANGIVDPTSPPVTTTGTLTLFVTP